MKKIILTYGLIAGAIVGTMLAISIPLYNNGVITIENGQWVGYSIMIIALSLIFFAVKNYRDQHLGGVISFGRAFQVGILVTLVAAIVYAITWEICYHTIAKNFMQLMADSYKKQLEMDFSDAAIIQQKTNEMNQMMEMYKNPAVRFGMTILEILPVGLALSILSAVILKKKTV
jgi:hypothetical protein